MDEQLTTLCGLMLRIRPYNVDNYYLKTEIGGTKALSVNILSVRLWVRFPVRGVVGVSLNEW